MPLFSNDSLSMQMIEITILAFLDMEIRHNHTARNTQLGIIFA